MSRRTMSKKLSRLTEFRLFLILAIIVLAWHILSLLSSFLSMFSNIALLVFLSWLLAFILEPLATYLSGRGLNRITAAAVIYTGIALLIIALIWSVLPTSIAQLAQLAGTIPYSLPQNSLFSVQIQNFLANTLSNSVNLASQIASGLTGVLLIFILSFYFLISKDEISKTLKNLVPHDYQDDYAFLENVINTTFAAFLRVQVFLGLILGLVVFLCLKILQVEFAASTSLISAVLAMIPVVGGIIFLIPPALAALTISFEKMVITTIVLALTSQLIYNLVGPKILSQALKIHPIIVLITFLVGYTIAGIWGAVFAVPITSTLTVIGKDLIKYWQEEAS